MRPDVTEKVLQRIDTLLATTFTPGDRVGMYAAHSEGYQATLTLLHLVHGPDNVQARLLASAAEKARKSQFAQDIAFAEVWPVVVGTLRTLRTDVRAGLVGNLMRRGMGVVLVDMLSLAKQALDDGQDGAKNVAAVLCAAAYEDAIRRMGELLAGVDDRRDLSEVISALKKADVLTGAPLTTALGYLKFRNDALHADWSKISPPLVSSCVAFTEGLILQYLA